MHEPDGPSGSGGPPRWLLLGGISAIALGLIARARHHRRRRPSLGRLKQGARAHAAGHRARWRRHSKRS